MLHEPEKGNFHLNTALKMDSEYYIIIEELFPSIFARKSVKDKISLHLNPAVNSVNFAPFKIQAMRRSFKDSLIISVKGMAMGAADVVPGVSGGTIAFISGIY